MKQNKLNNETAIRFIDETINLIREKGSNIDVNLRQISKRVGCAHTNAYNYFDGFAGLTWAAFDRALDIYGKAVFKGLHPNISQRDYFIRFVNNMIEFAIEEVGLYRFISTDPLDIKNMSENLLMKIGALKNRYYILFRFVSNGDLTNDESDKAADILLAYLDGEIFNLINYRYLGEDDILGRVVSNVEYLYGVLTSKDRITNKLNTTRTMKDFIYIEKETSQE